MKNFAEYAAPGESDSIATLAPGQGAIIREGLSRIAAYRGEDGTVLNAPAISALAPATPAETKAKSKAKA